MVGRDGQDVVVAADGRVRVAEDAAEFGVLQQPADLRLHLLVDLVEPLADGGEVAAGHVEDVPAAVDAPADRLRDGAEVFDAGEEVDEPGEVLGEPHPVAVHGPGAGERLADFEELLGREHGSDGGPAGDEPDVVQPAERRRLAEPQGGDHLGDEGEFLADRVRVGGRLDVAGEVAAERGRGVAGEGLADLVELEQVERVRVHDGGGLGGGGCGGAHARWTPRRAGGFAAGARELYARGPKPGFCFGSRLLHPPEPRRSPASKPQAGLRGVTSPAAWPRLRGTGRSWPGRRTWSAGACRPGRSTASARSPRPGRSRGTSAPAAGRPRT